MSNFSFLTDLSLFFFSSFHNSEHADSAKGKEKAEQSGTNGRMKIDHFFIRTEFVDFLKKSIKSYNPPISF